MWACWVSVCQAGIQGSWVSSGWAGGSGTHLSVCLTVPEEMVGCPEGLQRRMNSSDPVPQRHDTKYPRGSHCTYPRS